MNDWKRKFIIIWMGQLFSILTSTVAQFAIILWVSVEAGPAEVLSLPAGHVPAGRSGCLAGCIGLVFYAVAAGPGAFLSLFLCLFYVPGNNRSPARCFRMVQECRPDT